MHRNEYIDRRTRPISDAKPCFPYRVTNLLCHARHQNRLSYPVNNRPMDVHKHEKCVILFDLQNWIDKFLDWDPDAYNGTEYLILYADDVWLPDTVIYNRCAQFVGNSAIVAA